ncbi:MAG: hypothetical protein WCK29_03670 [archaeon]
MKKSLFFYFALFVLVFSSMVSAKLDFGGTNMDFSTSFNSALQNNFVIADNLQQISKIVFGIGDVQITTADFIILILCWLIMLLVIHELVDVFSNGSKKLISWVISIVITLLIATSGAIREIAVFFFGLGSFFDALNGTWSLTFRLVFALVISAVIGYLLIFFTRRIRKMSDREANELAGERLAVRSRGI